MALGFGSDMGGSDMVIFYGRDAENVEDAMAGDYRTVDRDSQQDVVVKSSYS